MYVRLFACACVLYLVCFVFGSISSVATDLYKGLDGADVEAYVLEGEGAGARRGHGEVGNTREGPDGAGGTREGVEQVDPGRRRLMGLSEVI